MHKQKKKSTTIIAVINVIGSRNPKNSQIIANMNMSTSTYSNILMLFG